MYIDSKAISWLILAGGLFLYLWNITENEFVYATIFMASSILLWMFVGVLVIGGIYFLSYYDVDETVVSESKTFFEFVRTVLQ